MMNETLFNSEFVKRFGTVKRARGCFLYTASGIRVTDLYQNSGRAILGWGGDSAFTVFKNTLNRGLTGSFATDFPYRTEKAVSELFESKRKVFFFNSYKSAVEAAVSVSALGTGFWRAWETSEQNWKENDCIIFVPPFAWGEQLFVLAVKFELLENCNFSEKLLSSAINIPPALHAGITRSIYNLIAAIKERKEKDWFCYDKILCKYWQRKGPYLWPKIKEDFYEKFVIHCLDCNLLISPNYNIPSIIPFGADLGVFTKLKNNPFEKSVE